MPPSSSAAALDAQDQNPLRFWFDEFFFAEGETVLLREAVAASGGAAVVAGETRNRVLQLKSYQLSGKMDVMWTGRAVGVAMACWELPLHVGWSPNC